MLFCFDFVVDFLFVCFFFVDSLNKDAEPPIKYMIYTCTTKVTKLLPQSIKARPMVFSCFLNKVMERSGFHMRASSLFPRHPCSMCEKSFFTNFHTSLSDHQEANLIRSNGTCLKVYRSSMSLMLTNFVMRWRISSHCKPHGTVL